ncbi:MAG: DUF4837 family protein [Bacteroidota bacterium]
MPITGFVRLLFFSLMVSVLGACSNLQVKPNAVGRPGQVLVVAEEETWEGVVGEAFRDYFDQAYPILPQPEPIFDLTYIAPEDMAKVHKGYRVIMILGNISKNNSTARLIRQSLGEEKTAEAMEDFNFNLAYREDLWASGQLVTYLFAPNDAQLIENIQTRYPIIEKRWLGLDREIAHANAYMGGTNRPAKNRLERILDLKLELPTDYREAIIDSVDQTVWYRRESNKSSSNILIRVRPYDEQTPVTQASLIATRDSIGKNYITSAVEGAYMIIDNENMPLIFDETTVAENYALEARGIWVMENDFMGGAFLSYMIYDATKQRVVFIDGFLYAPDEDKRHMMQRFEAIFETLQL